MGENIPLFTCISTRVCSYYKYQSSNHPYCPSSFFPVQAASNSCHSLQNGRYLLKSPHRIRSQVPRRLPLWEGLRFWVSTLLSTQFSFFFFLATPLFLNKKVLIFSNYFHVSDQSFIWVSLGFQGSVHKGRHQSVWCCFGEARWLFSQCCQVVRGCLISACCKVCSFCSYLQLGVFCFDLFVIQNLGFIWVCEFAIYFACLLILPFSGFEASPAMLKGWDSVAKLLLQRRLLLRNRCAYTFLFFTFKLLHGCDVCIFEILNVILVM